MTQADYIRAMTDEELAIMLNKHQCGVDCPVGEYDKHKCHLYKSCYDCWLDWLKQEIPAPPPPLCLTCAHANMSVTDDFADCICAVSGGYEGGKTECKDYERKQRNGESTL